MTLTERITFLLNKAIKEEKRFTQVELAKFMDIAPASVNKWMSGGAPAIDKLPKLCEILDISPNELFDYHANEEQKKTMEMARDLRKYPEYRNIFEVLIKQLMKDIELKSK